MSKKKARFALTICDNKPDRFDRQIRRDVGVNISKEMSVLEKSSEEEIMSKLSQSVEDFFLQDHITNAPIIPDIIEKNRKCLYHYYFFSFIFLQVIIPTCFLFCMRNCQHFLLPVSKFFL